MSEAKELQKAEHRLVQVSEGRPKYPVRAKEAFGVTAGDWRALVDAVWPSAETVEGVELALAYCRARNLDPFKRPVHVVPVWNAKLGRNVESVWPGIGELRTTASRTGLWAGCDEATFGPETTRTFKGTTGKGQYEKQVEKTVTFPEWSQMTVYKMVQGQRVPFPGPKVRWHETYSTIGRTDLPNEMWETRPYGQLEKCAEAAALRRAFPEEIGSDYIAEEAGRLRPQPIDITPEPEAGSRTEALTSKLKERRAARKEEEQPKEVAAAPAEPAAPTPAVNRDEIVEQLRASIKENYEGRSEAKEAALELAFGTRSWVQVTKLPPEQLAAGWQKWQAEHAGERRSAPALRPEDVEALREAARAAGVSWEAVEGQYGGPLGEYIGLETREQFIAEVEEEIERLAKEAENA